MACYERQFKKLEYFVLTLSIIFGMITNIAPISPKTSNAAVQCLLTVLACETRFEIYAESDGAVKFQHVIAFALR